jgi:hypothetical protein
MTHHFISYMHRRPNREWEYDNTVIKGHPFGWLSRQTRDFGEWEYKIISYQEITYAEYNAFKELIG